MGAAAREAARGPGRRSAVAGAVTCLASCLLGASSCLVVPGDPGPADVTFAVHARLERRPISPWIYGGNVARDPAANRLTLVRLGGNRWTAYNWENNASNAGSDWCFQNDGLLSGSSVPGAAVRGPVDAAHAAGAAAMVTVPNVDFVAADKNGGSNPPGCSGDVRGSGPDYLETRFRANEPSKDGPLSSVPDPTDGFVYQDEFVHWLEETVGGPVLYSLDNEPDLWAFTHAEVHPQPVAYEELVERNVAFAAAIKSVAPDALVSGPVSYGFYGYVTLQDAPEAGPRGHFLSFWLAALRDAEVRHGRRLVDLLDVHWYPEAYGDGVRITGPETRAGVAAARVQAPRSLWDPSYVENSWISGYLGGPVALLPDLQARIDAHYPGTGIAITEWNYGGGGHISGALATADALGVFGREGVRVAALWELNGDERFTYAAMKAFRNYDGAGSAFGDTSIQASSSDVATATVYASADAMDPDRVVLIAINKTSAVKRAGITLIHARAFGRAEVYTVTAEGGPAPVRAADLAAVDANAFNYDMPPASISVIVPKR